MPAISIIIPCYNYGRFLAHTLESVAGSSFQDWECILIDDGSTDDTAQVAAKYTGQDNRFRYHRQPNAGLSEARNTGLSMSRGKYIQFLDADDALHADKLQLQAGFLDKNAGADLVYGQTLYFHTDAFQKLLPQRLDHPATHRHLQKSAGGAALIKNLCKANLFEVSAPLVRKSLIEKGGRFDPEYKSFEDWHFWIKCAFAGGYFAFWPQPGTESFVRFGHTSMMSHQVAMNEQGFRLRRYLHSLLPLHLRGYNYYRTLRLHAKRMLIALNRK